MTLEERVDALEKNMVALTNALAKSGPARRDWRATFGLSKDDPGFDEMIQLGQAYRKNSDQGNDCAHS